MRATVGKKPSPRIRRRHTTEVLEDVTDRDESEEQEPEIGPLRRCIVLRERLPKERMIRFVVAPDRSVVPDLGARLPGRGIWLSASRDVIEPARAKGTLVRAFARAARGPVSVPPDLPAVLETALIRRISELLGLTRRAGQAMAGFEKAREWMRTSRVRLVLQALDGSEAERTRFLSGLDSSIPVLTPLPGAAMGRVFGRDYVVHVAIAPGKLAEALLIEATRLAGLQARPAAADRRDAAGTKDDEAGANG